MIENRYICKKTFEHYIYLPSITKKAHRAYGRVLEGVLWSYVVEGIGEPGENRGKPPT